jgi:hypothetical protein
MTTLQTIIPEGLNDLCKLRWEYEQDGEADPRKWQDLADMFRACAAFANMEKCQAKARYYREML